MHARIRTAAVMAVIGLVASATGWSPAGAADLTSFDARAQAEGFRYTFGAPGFVAVDAHSSSKRDDATGAIIAEAVTTADMINIGGTLKILSGTVSAKVSRTAGGDPVRESSFHLDGVNIGGQAVGFNDKGFVFAGSGAPIPPDNPLMQALRQAGIDVRYLAATNDDHGVTSPGL